MPTTRPRHMLTETADIGAALDDAAVAWPDLRDDRRALLRKLVHAGWSTLQIAGRIEAIIHRSAGFATGLYTPDERAQQVAEWPE